MYEYFISDSSGTTVVVDGPHAVVHTTIFIGKDALQYHLYYITRNTETALGLYSLPSNAVALSVLNTLPAIQT